jgi:hypothetical protein
MAQGRLYDLPLPAQRALSFLPGKWSPVVVQDAEWSSEGRFKWWENILGEKMIKNWWVGDGFGASEKELMVMSEFRQSEEAVYLMGQYHNGPLSAIRYAGVIGLILFYVLMIMSAVYAYRCVQKCRATLLLPVAIFLAIQLIWQPFVYTFIFGAYNTDLPQQILMVGLLRVVMRMAEQFPARQPLATTQAMPAPGPGDRALTVA